MESKKESWADERFELSKTLGGFLYRAVPRGVGWWYTLGSATMVTFILLVVTGIFLMMNYSPSPDHAYDSVQYIMTGVPFGKLIRSIHFWSASAMVVLIGLHAWRTFFMAAYKYPREVTWIFGAFLFILVMGSSFTGYLLPWDQKAYWATNVGTGIAGQVPLIGSFVQKVLLGGPTIGAVTLTRFFTIHVAILPSLIMLVIGIHIYLVVKLGISAPPKVWGKVVDEQDNRRTISR
jgi:quinol-cytochrome oxidoreductase complex cytochrome b subunit